MGNERYLIDASMRSPEERRELGRKGGIKSGEAKRRKKQMREVCEIVSQFKAPEKLARNINRLAPEDVDIDADMMTAAIFGQFMAATKGSTHAMEWIQQLIGNVVDDEQDEDELSKALRELAESPGYDKE